MTFVLSDIKVRLFPKRKENFYWVTSWYSNFSPAGVLTFLSCPGQYSFAFTIIVPWAIWMTVMSGRIREIVCSDGNIIKWTGRPVQSPGEILNISTNKLFSPIAIWSSADLIDNWDLTGPSNNQKMHLELWNVERENNSVWISPKHSYFSHSSPASNKNHIKVGI